MSSLKLIPILSIAAYRLLSAHGQIAQIRDKIYLPISVFSFIYLIYSTDTSTEPSQYELLSAVAELQKSLIPYMYMKYHILTIYGHITSDVTGLTGFSAFWAGQ